MHLPVDSTILKNEWNVLLLEKKVLYLHPQIEQRFFTIYSAYKLKKIHGLFVYRLGRKIFILERGVRLPYRLLELNKRS